MRSQFSAAVHLAGSLSVSTDALGQEFAGKTDSADFRLTFPVHDPEATEVHQSLLPPFDLPIATSEGFWGSVLLQGSTPSVSVRGIAVYGETEEVADDEENDSEPGEATVWTFGDDFSKWYEIAASWIELWTNQLVEYRGHRSSLGGKVNLAGVEHEDPFVWGNAVVLHTFFGKKHGFARTPASVSMIRSAFRKATEKIQPPSEWIALFNARRTSDDRFALIEAATAAEISLAQAAERHLLALTADGADWFMRRANGVTALAQMLRALDRSHDLVRVAEQIAAPRNRAVHQGIRPTGAEVSASIEAAHQILKACSPLAGWE